MVTEAEIYAAQDQMRQARAIADAIRATRDAATARILLGTLSGFANSEALVSTGNAGLIGTWVSECATECNNLETEETQLRLINDVTRIMLEQQHRAQVDSLASRLSERHIFLENEQKFVDSIKHEEKYTILQSGDDGKFQKDENGNYVTTEVSGTDMKTAVTLLAAYSQRDKLDAKGKAELNMMLYGTETEPPPGPEGDAAREMAKEKLRDASQIANGRAAAEAAARGDWKTVQETEKHNTQSLEATDRVKEAEKQYAQTIQQHREEPTPKVEEKLHQQHEKVKEEKANETKVLNTARRRRSFDNTSPTQVTAQTPPAEISAPQPTDPPHVTPTPAQEESPPAASRKHRTAPVTTPLTEAKTFTSPVQNTSSPAAPTPHQLADQHSPKPKDEIHPEKTTESPSPAGISKILAAELEKIRNALIQNNVVFSPITGPDVAGSLTLNMETAKAEINSLLAKGDIYAATEAKSTSPKLSIPDNASRNGMAKT